jgi:hypothetical protein
MELQPGMRVWLCADLRAKCTQRLKYRAEVGWSEAMNRDLCHRRVLVSRIDTEEVFRAYRSSRTGDDGYIPNIAVERFYWAALPVPEDAPHSFEWSNEEWATFFTNLLTTPHVVGEYVLQCLRDSHPERYDDETAAMWHAMHDLIHELLAR